MKLKLFGLEKFLGEKKRTVNPLVLWDNIIAEYFKKNESESGPTRSYNLYGDTNAIYSGGKNITYVYLIDNYPRVMELSFRKSLRRECKPGVKISFVTNFTRHHIDWNSHSNRNRMKTWKQLDDANHKEVTVYELASEVGTIDTQNYKKESLLYLINADKRRDRKLFNTQGIMVVTGERGEAFDDTIEALELVCKGNIKIKRITGNISDYLETFSPFSLKLNSNILRRSGSNVLTDEIAARLNSYDQGTVGRGTLYWGTDIYSKKLVLKEPKEVDTDAENWLIAAETGGGKSYVVKTLSLQLISRPDVVGTINDIEGEEYEDLAYIVSVNENVVMLDIGDAGGNYFDPVEVHETGVDKLDKMMFALSSSFTIALFKSLAGYRLLDNRDWVSNIIKNGVSAFYNEMGINKYDPSTWKASKGKTIFDVFESIKRYVPENPNDEFYADRELLISALENYLSEENRQNGRFKNKISIDSIKNAKLIVNSFGMKARSEETIDEVDMALMQLYTALIAQLQSVFAHSKGMYNFKVWEEFQRWGGFPGSEDILKPALSGGRKLGDINIIVTNRPSELLETDRFKIFDSITSFAIGSVGDSNVRKVLCDRLAMPLMRKELDLIEENRKNAKESKTESEEMDYIKMNPYAKSFLVGLDKKEFAISKVELPDSISNTALFQTGVKVGQNK